MLQTTGSLPTARRHKSSWVGRNLSPASYTARVKEQKVEKWNFPDLPQKAQIQPRNNNSF